MNVDIYIKERNGSRSIRIPWLPEKINFESGGTIRATYDILEKGPVEVPTGSGLCGYSWESTFPGKYRTDKSMMRGKWQAPSTYHNILEEWKKKGSPLNLMVTGYPINKDVILDDYQGSAEGGFGDIEYEVKFIEDRDITINATTVKTSTPAPKRTSTQPKTHKIKKGDTLWAISKKYYKNGNKWKTIYNANKAIIESTAKKYGKKSSNNGHWIYPGVTLKIPQ